MTYTNNLTAEETAFVENTVKLIRFERIGWLVNSVLYVFASFLYMLSAILFFVLIRIYSNDVTAGVPSVASYIYIAMFFYCSFLFLIIAIIGFIALKKSGLYYSTARTDIMTTYNRCTSIGMLVFCYLFGGYAFPLFLVNFIRLRSHLSVVKSISERQV